MEEFYMDLVNTCNIYGIPVEEAEYWYNSYVEFVREELNNRIKGKNPNKINTEEVWATVLRGLIESYGVC